MFAEIQNKLFNILNSSKTNEFNVRNDNLFHKNVIFLCGHEDTPSPITLIIPLGVKVRCPIKRANTRTHPAASVRDQK